MREESISFRRNRTATPELLDTSPQKCLNMTFSFLIAILGLAGVFSRHPWAIRQD